MLSHAVYFTLKEPTGESIARLVAACRRDLTDHPGTRAFSVGTRAGTARDVNDRDWDVALHLVFEDRAAHDRYQEAPRHRRFIEENSASWARVRVFDADLDEGGGQGRSDADPSAD